ncbi:aminotransferase class V-fold PLP-dependent enzyme [Pseudohongiella nitratireducens]|nr:aminotransferase class V-fold PLP-dependent enzyme [Pseudohongiella nitratireducens]MDF1624364.1 aminotransferase class V-fold PLP-dependent enzyme [Pseudohongiella nitratireducens]
MAVTAEGGSTVFQWIADNEVGALARIKTPFGVKPLIYADYTASGRSLVAVESLLNNQVRPFYANTHSESSYTGSQTTGWREAARAMIKKAVNANASDRLLFCGSGATAAINRLIQLLGLEKGGQACTGKESDKGENCPVVFIGPYEHHSNELPWRESVAKVVTIPLNSKGQIDCDVLEAQLKKYADRPLLIGSFSAASNVTGTISDVPGVTKILKQYGALACWDYAAAAAYCPIDMNGVHALDAVFISTHKLPGGPGTPGLLIAKASLFRNSRPGMPGGGTVSFVSPDNHHYLADLERKEEGGTPAIIESIRAGLVFSIRSQLDMTQVNGLELKLARRVIQRLSQHPDIEIIGDHSNPRLPIISMRLWHQGRQLHYGYVVSLLNDLYGIQARGGCSCAGPYAHHLLGIDTEESRQLLQAMQDGDTVLRPGWVRINFTYFMNEEVIEYLLSAIEALATHAINLLPDYHYNKVRGTWDHVQAVQPDLPDLSQLDWLKQSEENVKNTTNGAFPRTDLTSFLHAAHKALDKSKPRNNRSTLGLSPVSKPNERLRWFWVASDFE